MKYAEAEKLKKGDLVIMTRRSNAKYYVGMIFEIEEITGHDMWGYRMTLKQPGIKSEFRLFDQDTRRFKKV